MAYGIHDMLIIALYGGNILSKHLFRLDSLGETVLLQHFHRVLQTFSINDRKRQENRKFTSGVLPALYEAVHNDHKDTDGDIRAVKESVLHD